MADLIDVPSGMELAVDVAVGKGLENIVVETVEDAKKAIQFIKNERLGRVTFLPLDILRVKKVPPQVINQINAIDGVLGLASQIINYPPQYEVAVEYLLGRILDWFLALFWLPLVGLSWLFQKFQLA